jgi:hypothetical protein
LIGKNDEALGQQHNAIAPALGSGQLVVLPMTTGDKGQVLAVVDPQRQAMCIYRIDPTTGKIALKSARNLQFDLKMSSWNNEAPLPQEIQSLLEQR